jgi:hypothetical protein
MSRLHMIRPTQASYCDPNQLRHACTRMISNTGSPQWVNNPKFNVPGEDGDSLGQTYAKHVSLLSLPDAQPHSFDVTRWPRPTVSRQPLTTTCLKHSANHCSASIPTSTPRILGKLRLYMSLETVGAIGPTELPSTPAGFHTLGQERRTEPSSQGVRLSAKTTRTH